MKNLLEKLGACVLLDYLKSISTNQEKMMATVTELRAALDTLTAKVAVLNTTASEKLSAVQADVAYLRDVIAAGTPTADDVAKANAAVANIQSVVDALKAFDAVPEFPAPTPAPPTE